MSNKTTAKVYQYGRYFDSVREVELPSYVHGNCPMLQNGRETVSGYCHQLVAGESFGVGSAESYRIIAGTAPEGSAGPA